jgi:Flp pilus assembly protein TadG
MGKKTASSGVRAMLNRLRKDQGGNTIAIVAVSLVPLLAMVGGGVDASRAYMVKSRLQQACDAAALAGRKAVGEQTFGAGNPFEDSTAFTRSREFFFENFPDGYQGTTDTEFVVGTEDDGTSVMGTATTTVPTVIMGLLASRDDDTAAERKNAQKIQRRNATEAGEQGLFTKQSIDLSVTCNATLEVNNSDITMVLDTTGSMTSSVSDGNGGTTTRIAALRAAAISFHSILTGAAEGTNARIRYAMVPYVNTVNVGRLLYNENPFWITGGGVDKTWNYQSRRPIYVYQTTETRTTNPADESRSSLTGAQCFNSFSKNLTAGSWTPASSGYSSGQNATKTGDPGATYTFAYKSWNGSTSTPSLTSTTTKTCIRKVTRVGPVTVNNETYDGTIPGAVFLRWEHRQLAFPVNDYVNSIDTSNPAVKVPSNVLSDPITSRWAGCIEERTTSPSATFAYDGTSQRITPTAATDLDIDTAPSNAATKWKPYWPEVTYRRTTSSGANTSATVSEWGVKAETYCPKEAQLLQTMDTDTFAEYVNDLNANGFTYHDLGMLWGARLSSPTGIFADNVNAEPENGGFVTRHMIFMTDGQLVTSGAIYSAYGVENHDARVTGALYGSGRDARHNERFKALCTAVKAKGIRIWVVAFATELTTDMTNCASANSAFVSTNAAALNSTFVRIAESVADLRLSQ